MKLGKEEIQKIFLSVLLLIGLLYCYFTMLLGPLSKQMENATSTVGDLSPKIASAQATIRDAGAHEKDAPLYAATVDQIKALIPDGAPIAWLPPAATDFVKKRGIDKFRVSIGGETPDKDLTGFRRVDLTIDFAQIEVAQLGHFIAELENECPLWQITGVQLNALRENPQYQTAKLSLSVLVKE